MNILLRKQTDYYFQGAADILKEWSTKKASEKQAKQMRDIMSALIEIYHYTLQQDVDMWMQERKMEEHMRSERKAIIQVEELQKQVAELELQIKTISFL